jgi:hypothetical protein
MMTTKTLDPFDPVIAAQPNGNASEVEEAEAELLAECNDILESAKQQRKEMDADVSFNRAFISGSQLVGLDEVSQEFLRVVSMRQPDKFPSVDNKLLPIYRAYIGKMLKSLGQVNVRPRNDTYLETRASEGMSTYLEFIHDNAKLTKKTKKAFGVTAVAPAAYLMPVWDAKGGDSVAFCGKCEYVGEEEDIEQPCPSCSRNELMRVDQAITAVKMGQGDPAEAQYRPENVPELKATPQGELRVQFIRWEHGYLDPSAFDPEDMRYFIHERPMPVGVIRAHYPDKWEDIHDEDVTADRYLQRHSSGVKYRERKYDNHAMLRDFYFSPSVQFSGGRIVTTACDRILDVKSNIYAKLTGRIAVYLFRSDVFDDSIYGLPWASQVINLQRERNKLMSQKRAHREVTLHPVMVAEDGAGVNKRTEVSAPGERLLIKRGTTIQPYYLRNPPMPNYVMEEGASLTQAMEEKAGVTGHEMGRTSSDESGRYAAIIESQSNDTIRSITVENSVEWMGLNDAILQIGYHFRDAGRTWTVKRGGRLVSMSWATIGVKPKRGSVYLVEKDILSNNPVLRLTLAERLLKAGYFNDEETGRPDMQKFGQVAGLVNLAGFDSDQTDRRYGSQIPELVKQGVQVSPMPWDRVKVIAEELTDWLRSEGRYGDPAHAAQVANVWLQYSMAFIQHMQMTGAPMSPDAAASVPVQAGLKNMVAMTNPTPLSTSPGAGSSSGPVNPSAGESIKTADQAGEGAARQTTNQEGASM